MQKQTATAFWRLIYLCIFFPESKQPSDIRFFCATLQM